MDDNNLIRTVIDGETRWQLPESAKKHLRTFERGEPITIVGFVDTDDGTDGVTDNGKIIPLYPEIIGGLCTKEFDEEGHLKFYAPIIQNVRMSFGVTENNNEEGRR